jgi:hypothetical protein
MRARTRFMFPLNAFFFWKIAKLAKPNSDASLAYPLRLDMSNWRLAFARAPWRCRTELNH